MKKLLRFFSFVFAMFMLCANVANADNTMTIGNFEAKPGDEVVLPVMMTNTDAIIAFQFSLALPDGVSIKKEMNEDDELEYCVALTSRKKSDHTIRCGNLINGVHTIASISGGNKTYRDNSGAVCEIKLAINPNIKPGVYDVKICDIELSKEDGSAVSPADCVAKLTIKEEVKEIGKANIAKSITISEPVSELGKDIPAIGGKDRAKVTVNYKYVTRTFMSDNTYVDGAETSRSMVIYGPYTEVQPNLSTTVKPRTKVGSSTAEGKLTDASGNVLKAETTDWTKLADAQVVAKTLDIYQEANSVNYTDVTLNISKLQYNISADGSTVNLASTIETSQSVSYTTGVSSKGKVNITYAVKSAKDGFSLSGSTVTITKNIGAARNGFVVTVTATGEGGMVASKDVTFNQNVAELGKASIAYDINVSAPTSELGKDIPATGGKDRAKVTVSYKYKTRTFMGDGTYTDGTGQSRSIVIYGNEVSASSLGTTVKARTLVGTSTAESQLTDSGGNVLKGETTDWSKLSNASVTAKALDIYQVANTMNYADVSLSVSKVQYSFSADGESVDIASTVGATQSISYTTGITTKGEVSISYAVKTAKTGFSLSGSTITASKNTGAARNGFVVTVTATGEGGKVAKKDIVFNQAVAELGKAAIAYDIKVSAPTSETGKDIPATGGKDRAKATLSYKYKTRTFMGDGTYTDGAEQSKSVVIYGDEVNAETLGTTVKARSIVGTSTASGKVVDASGNVLKSETTSFNALKDCADVTASPLSIYQAENKATFSKMTFTVNPVDYTFDYNGGSLDLQTKSTAAQEVTYTTGIKRSGNVNISYKVKTEVNGFSLSGSNVVVSKNETTNSRNGFVVTVTAEGEDGQTISKDVTINQPLATIGEAKMAFDIKVSEPESELGKDIPAAGGKDRAVGTLSYQYKVRTFYENGTYADGAATAKSITITGDDVEAANLGTDVKERTLVGSSVAMGKIIDEDGSVLKKETDDFSKLVECDPVSSEMLNIYQEANTASYGEMSFRLTKNAYEVGVNGETIDVAETVKAEQKVTYTSGYGRNANVEITYAVKTPQDGFSLSGSSVVVTKNNSSSERKGFVITVTAIAEDGTTVADDITFNQMLNALGKITIAYDINVSLPTPESGKDIPAAGGNDRAKATLAYKYKERTFYDNGLYTDGEENSIETVIYGNYISQQTSLKDVEKERTAVGVSQASGFVVDESGNKLYDETTDYDSRRLCAEVKAENLTLYQEANKATYYDVLLDVTKDSYDFAAEGELVNLANTVTVSQAVSYTSGAESAAVVNVSYSVKNDVEGFSLTNSTVKASKNTGDARNGFVVVITAKGADNSVVTKEVVFNQAVGELGKATIAYEITISDPVSELGTDIPASGGKDRAKATLAYKYKTRTFMGDGTFFDGESTSMTTDIYGSYVEKSSLGTLETERTEVGNSIATGAIVDEDGNVLKMETDMFAELKDCEPISSTALTIYQEANEASYSDVIITSCPVSYDFTSDGGKYEMENTASQTVTYTSGDTRDGIVNFSYIIKDAREGFSLEGATVIATENKTSEARNDFVVTAVATGEGEKTSMQDITFGQPVSTSISSVLSLGDNVKIYDMNGRPVNRKVNDLPKGIYIINNRKYIIK